MTRELKMYRGDMIAIVEETDEKKQQLWDAMLLWCEKHNASIGESMQNDSFVIDAPEFMAEAIDDIMKFETKWVEGSEDDEF